MVILSADAGTGARLAALVGGAGVVCHNLSYEPSSLEIARVRRMDPALVLVDLDDSMADGVGVLSRFRDDARLRWAQIVPLRFVDVFETPRFATPWVETAVSRERELATQLSAGQLDVHVPLTGLGPARLLKLVSAIDGAYAITFETPLAPCRITLTAGRVTFVERSGHAVMGAALTSLFTDLLESTTGRAHVRRLGVTTDGRGPSLTSLLDTHAAGYVDKSARRNQFALTRPGLVRRRQRLARDYALSILAGAVAAMLVGLLLAPLLARLV